jgi:hypothetical protein
LTTNGSAAEPQPEQVQCLFIVVVDLDGSSRVILNPQESFLAQREATAKDVYPALANVLADFQSLKTAEAVLSMTMQVSQQMAAQAVGKEGSPPE